MKALFLAITVITCLCGLGCEMHPESPRTRGGQATEPEKTSAQPESALNPNPPSYFASPKSG